MSKLQLYYSSSRLSLVLTLWNIPPELLRLNRGFWEDIIPLPSRLKTMDRDGLGLLKSFSRASRGCCYIFQDFLDSNHPLALDGERYATAASACLKIIFIYDQALHSRCILRVDKRSQRHSTDLKPKPLWHRSLRHWHLRTYISGRKIPRAFLEFHRKIDDQRFRSGHLKFLLEKSAYSNNLLNFARRRVFRFRYLQRSHPTYMKEAIFALAKYIQRVTGETAEVRVCKSIWGRQKWFTAN